MMPSRIIDQPPILILHTSCQDGDDMDDVVGRSEKKQKNETSMDDLLASLPIVCDMLLVPEIPRHVVHPQRLSSESLPPPLQSHSQSQSQFPPQRGDDETTNDNFDDMVELLDNTFFHPCGLSNIILLAERLPPTREQVLLSLTSCRMIYDTGEALLRLPLEPLPSTFDFVIVGREPERTTTKSTHTVPRRDSDSDSDSGSASGSTSDSSPYRLQDTTTELRVTFDTHQAQEVLETFLAASSIADSLLHDVLLLTEDSNTTGTVSLEDDRLRSAIDAASEAESWKSNATIVDSSPGTLPSDESRITSSEATSSPYLPPVPHPALLHLQDNPLHDPLPGYPTTSNTATTKTAERSPRLEQELQALSRVQALMERDAANLDKLLDILTLVGLGLLCALLWSGYQLYCARRDDQRTTELRQSVERKILRQTTLPTIPSSSSSPTAASILSTSRMMMTTTMPMRPTTSDRTILDIKVEDLAPPPQEVLMKFEDEPATAPIMRTLDVHEASPRHANKHKQVEGSAPLVLLDHRTPRIDNRSRSRISEHKPITPTRLDFSLLLESTPIRTKKPERPSSISSMDPVIVSPPRWNHSTIRISSAPTTNLKMEFAPPPPTTTTTTSGPVFSGSDSSSKTTTTTTISKDRFVCSTSQTQVADPELSPCSRLAKEWAVKKTSRRRHRRGKKKSLGSLHSPSVLPSGSGSTLPPNAGAFCLAPFPLRPSTSPSLPAGRRGSAASTTTMTTFRSGEAPAVDFQAHMRARQQALQGGSVVTSTAVERGGIRSMGGHGNEDDEGTATDTATATASSLEYEVENGRPKAALLHYLTPKEDDLPSPLSPPSIPELVCATPGSANDSFVEDYW